MKPAESYVHNLPEPFRQMALQLQVLIEQQFPAAQLKYKWQLPFYYLDYRTMFCFINHRKNFLELGMPYAALLKRNNDHLTAGENRKMLRSLRYHSPGDIDSKILSEVLNELHGIRKP